MTGLEIIKKFEGCRLKAYADPATGGKPITIGYGTTRNANGGEFKLGESITQEKADAYLTRDFNAEKAVIMKDLNMAKLPERCIDALTSLCYNIKGGFASCKKSKCYAGIVAHSVTDLFHNWDWGVSQKGVELGLARRRAMELAEFLEAWK